MLEMKIGYGWFKVPSVNAFKLTINEAQLLRNPVIAEWIMSKPKAPEPEYPTEEMIHANESVNHFNEIIDKEWRRHVGHDQVPHLIQQTNARAAQLEDIGVPHITQEYFFRDFNEFRQTILETLKSLNDTTGDILAGGTSIMRFERVAVLTDYSGCFGSTVNALSPAHSYSTSRDAFDWLIRLGQSDSLLVSSVAAHNGRLMNYIGVIFKNSITKFDTLKQAQYEEPAEQHVSYLRYNYLLK